MISFPVSLISTGWYFYSIDYQNISFLQNSIKKAASISFWHIFNFWLVLFLFKHLYVDWLLLVIPKIFLLICIDKMSPPSRWLTKWVNVSIWIIIVSLLEQDCLLKSASFHWPSYFSSFMTLAIRIRVIFQRWSQITTSGVVLLRIITWCYDCWILLLIFQFLRLLIVTSR